MTAPPPKDTLREVPLEVEEFFYGCTNCPCVDHHGKFDAPEDCQCCLASHQRALAAGRPTHWIKTPEHLWASR